MFERVALSAVEIVRRPPSKGTFEGAPSATDRRNPLITPIKFVSTIKKYWRSCGYLMESVLKAQTSVLLGAGDK